MAGKAGAGAKACGAWGLVFGACCWRTIGAQ